MELLIFVLILFTIVFTIYLCGHITETLEEIKLARKDIESVNDRLNMLCVCTSEALEALETTREETEHDCIDACDPKTCPVTGCKYKEALGDPLDEAALYRLRVEELVSERSEQQVIKKETSDDAEAERDCVDGCEPEKCPVEDCKHKKAFLWSLLS